MNTFIKRNLIAIVKLVFMFAILLLTSTALAETVPHTFTPGTTIKSSEINENFDYLAERSMSLSESTLSYSGTVKATTFEGDGSLLTNLPSSSGFDFHFPDGFDNLIPVINSNYIVPEGKNLYITSVSSYAYLKVNGLIYDAMKNFDLPIIIGAGQIVETVDGIENNCVGAFGGFVVDASVSPVIIDLQTSYTIPAGKNLFIYKSICLTYPAYICEFWVNDFKFSDDISKHNFAFPVIVGSGSVLDCPNNHAILIGYLKNNSDEINTVLPGNLLAPTNISGVSSYGSGEVTVTWENVSEAESYNIYWSRNPNVTKNTGVLITNVRSPFVHQNLITNETYYYIITALNDSGESIESEEIIVITEPYSIEFNMLPTIVCHDNVCTLNIYWYIVNVDFDPVGYKIYDNGVEIGTSSTTSYYDVIDLNSNSTGCITVRAYDSDGNLSLPSNEHCCDLPII